MLELQTSGSRKGTLSLWEHLAPRARSFEPSFWHGLCSSAPQLHRGPCSWGEYGTATCSRCGGTPSEKAARLGSAHRARVPWRRGRSPETSAHQPALRGTRAQGHSSGCAERSPEPSWGAQSLGNVGVSQQEPCIGAAGMCGWDGALGRVFRAPWSCCAQSPQGFLRAGWGPSLEKGWGPGCGGQGVCERPVDAPPSM